MLLVFVGNVGAMHLSLIRWLSLIWLHVHRHFRGGQSRSNPVFTDFVRFCAFIGAPDRRPGNMDISESRRSGLTGAQLLIIQHSRFIFQNAPHNFYFFGGSCAAISNWLLLALPLFPQLDEAITKNYK